MKFFASIVVLLLASATLCAQDEAKIVLDAPHSVRIGELVRLDASESTADSLKWCLVPDSPDFLVYDSGLRAVFSGRSAGEFQFIVAGAKDGTVDVITFTINVLAPPDAPTTQSLTEWIPYWNWSIGLPSDECHRVADVYRTISERSPALKTPAEWVEATSNALQAALGKRIETWKPLLNKIGSALEKRAQSGALISPEQHAEAWLEVANGLKKC